MSVLCDRDEDVVVAKLIVEVQQSNYEIVKKTGASGHAFEPPTGP